MELDGRFCVMLKNTYKKGLGIVHGSSNTGNLRRSKRQVCVFNTIDCDAILE